MLLLLLLELRDELDPLDLNVLPLLGRLGLEACDELDPLDLNVLLAGFLLLELPESDRL